MHSRGTRFACHRRQHVEHRWFPRTAFRFDREVPIFDIAAKFRPLVEEHQDRFEVRFRCLAHFDLVVAELHQVACTVHHRNLLFDGRGDYLNIGPVLIAEEFDVFSIEHPDRPSAAREVDQQVVCRHCLAATGRSDQHQIRIDRGAPHHFVAIFVDTVWDLDRVVVGQQIDFRVDVRGGQPNAVGERGALLERDLVCVVVPLCAPASGEHRIDRAFDTSSITVRDELRSDFVPHLHGGDFSGLGIDIDRGDRCGRSEQLPDIAFCTRHRFTVRGLSFRFRRGCEDQSPTVAVVFCEGEESPPLVFENLADVVDPCVVVERLSRLVIDGEFSRHARGPSAPLRYRQHRPRRFRESHDRAESFDDFVDVDISELFSLPHNSGVDRAYRQTCGRRNGQGGIPEQRGCGADTHCCASEAEAVANPVMRPCRQ